MQVFNNEDKKSETLVSRNLSISSSDDSGTSLSKTQKPAFVIGIGASAGGLDSLEKFFRHMPDCTGLAFVVIQHLSPDYKSMMVELLSKHTKMAIKQAEDGMEVKPDRVYLIPPKVSLTIAKLKLHLSNQGQLHVLHMPIDIFFRSLAEDMERRAIGIVLSGTGSDGTLGSRAIKETGGMLMVQDPNSAQFDGMPNSAIHTGLADYILPPEKMPETLLKYAKHPLLAHENRTTPSSKEGDILANILRLIQNETGLDFAYYKPSTVIRRIERRMGINQIEKIKYYLRYLERNPGEIQVLYSELLIGVTRFFRDKEAFHIILQKVIPEIVAAYHGHPAKAPIRIWIAGCSSGEEVYSLAIFLSEYLEKHNTHAEIKIFATDIDQRAVDIAAIGKYPASIVSDIPIALLSKYFFKSNDYYQVVEKIRKMVIFARHNLLTDPPFNNLDLVTCRNLLIYLRNDIQQKVLSMFGFALKKDGFLFLGSSETIGNLNHLFTMFDNKWRIYRSKGKANLANFPFMEKSDRSEKGSSLSLHTTPRPLTSFEPDTVTQRIEAHLLDFHVPPTAVLDQDLNLVHTVGDINDFLQFPKGRVSFNIFKLSDTNLSGLIANAIRKARQSQQAVRYKNVLLFRKDRKLSLTLLVKPFIDQKTKRRFFLLAFEGAEKALTASQPAQEMQIGEGQELHIQELEHELQLTRENLQATIEELETSNEELQASNEELMSANEELQSTNEELQSVNEELYTLNSEYQNKIEELTALNNDIDNFLNSTHIGTIFLDRALRIRKFTPAVREQFPIMEYDVGRPITHFAANFDYPDLVKDLQAVLDALLPYERHVRLTNGKTYQVRILPYRTSNNTIDGLILTFVDITRLVEMARELSEKENLYHTLMETAPHCIWLADSSGKIIYLNPTRYGDNDPAAGDSIGDIWLQAIHPDDAQRVREEWQQALQQDAVFRSEGRFLTKAGNYRHRRLLGIPIKNEAGKTNNWAGINTDITDFKRTEQELANREALFRRLYELAPIGMALNILNGRFVMANQTLLNLLGYTENELTNLSLQDLTALEDTEEEVLLFNGLRTTGQYGPCYKECLHRDGHRVSIIFNGILYTHTDGSQYLWSFMQKCSHDN